MLIIALPSLGWAGDMPAFPRGKVQIVSGTQTHRFTVGMATEPSQMERGLMFVDNLPEDGGMLFVWPSDQPVSMWMKNTLIPLDMLFIDGQNRIIQIKENTVPFSESLVTARMPVRAVLEIAGGISSKLGIKEGDKLTWRAE